MTPGQVLDALNAKRTMTSPCGRRCFWKNGKIRVYEDDGRTYAMDAQETLHALFRQGWSE